MGSVDDILTACQNGVAAINGLNQQISATFSSITISTTAPAAGSIVFNSSIASAFMSITTSSGGNYYIALY